MHQQYIALTIPFYLWLKAISSLIQKLIEVKSASPEPTISGQPSGGKSVQTIKLNRITFKQPQTFAPIFVDNAGQGIDGNKMKAEASKKKISMQSVSSGPIKSPLIKLDPQKQSINAQEASFITSKTYKNSSIQHTPIKERRESQKQQSLNYQQ